MELNWSGFLIGLLIVFLLMLGVAVFFMIDMYIRKREIRETIKHSKNTYGDNLM